jgi:1-acyl-sn-glycerol-3-phosphate acyltransferase
MATADPEDRDISNTKRLNLEPLTPTPAEALREQLPGLEPERRITDWGRSERVEALFDRTIAGFLYHYWFRVEVEEIEHVPREGGALLLANHAGALPPDGAMIAKAIRERHPAARPIHLLTDERLEHLPGLGMLLRKLGRVADHPANIHRLLFDERQLVLAFPEGERASRKPFKERYRLRDFDARLVRAALAAHAPIVPVAVLGTEEAGPVLARVPALAGPTRIARLPLTAPLPLPAKVRIRFLEPVHTADLLASDRATVQALTHDIRALIQENLLELVAARRSVWLG